MYWKEMEGCLLVYSSLINIVCLKCSTMKNVFSKQLGFCFLVYWSLIKRLMLYTMKHVYSNQVLDCFLDYSSFFKRLMFYYKKHLFKTGERLIFFDLLITILRLMFHYKKCVFGCECEQLLLVYSSSFIRLPLVAPFDLKWLLSSLYIIN